MDDHPDGAGRSRLAFDEEHRGGDLDGAPPAMVRTSAGTRLDLDDIAEEGGHAHQERHDVGYERLLVILFALALLAMVALWYIGGLDG